MGRRRRRGKRRRSRSRGQWSTLYAVFGTEVGGFAQFFTAIATSASGRSGGGVGASDAKLALRIGLFRGNAVVHVAVGDFAVGATAEVVEVDGDVAVHHGLQASAVVVVLTSLVADEEDDDDEDEQDDEGGQGADDDADVVVAVLLVLLLLVHAVRALVVCGSIQPYTAFRYRQMRVLVSRVWARRGGVEGVGEWWGGGGGGGMIWHVILYDPLLSSTPPPPLQCNNQPTHNDTTHQAIPESTHQPVQHIASLHHPTESIWTLSFSLYPPSTWLPAYQSAQPMHQPSNTQPTVPPDSNTQTVNRSIQKVTGQYKKSFFFIATKTSYSMISDNIILI